VTDDPVRLWPGDTPPSGVHVLDDDWFRFYGPKPGSLSGTTHFEVHELSCTIDRCCFRDEPCPFHPPGCKCSYGACQNDPAEVVAARMRGEFPNDGQP
jgi:hypothetical protein